MSFHNRLPEGKVCKSPICGGDLVATFFAYAGLQQPWKIHGRDLTNVFKNPEAREAPRALLLEEIVDRHADLVAHPGDATEGVGARPQVGDAAQELEGVALFLQFVRLGVGGAVDGDGVGGHLGRLPLGRRRLDLAGDGDATAGGQVLDLRLVIGQRGGGDDLDVALRRAVIQLEEAEAALGVAPGADPAL